MVGAIGGRWARDKRCSSWRYRRTGACEGDRVQEVGCAKRRDLWLPKYVQIEVWRSCRDEETRTDAQIEPVRTVRDSKRSPSLGSHTQQRHPPDARSHSSLLERPYYTQNVDKSLGPVSAVRSEAL